MGETYLNLIRNLKILLQTVTKDVKQVFIHFLFFKVATLFTHEIYDFWRAIKEIQGLSWCTRPARISIRRTEKLLSVNLDLEFAIQQNEMIF